MKPYYEDDAVTIYHGNSMEIAPDLPLTFDAIITDPPYAETDLEWDRWPTLWPVRLQHLSNCLWCFGSFRMFFDRKTDFMGWKLAQDLVWEKHNGSGMHADRFRRVHEHALNFYQGAWKDLRREVPQVPTENSTGAKTGWIRHTKPAHYKGIGAGAYVKEDGNRMQRSVIRARSMHSDALHPTEKPADILTPLINYSVAPGGIILDPFSGSGSTGRAAKDSGRRAVLIEAEERYCETSANRMRQEILFPI